VEVTRWACLVPPRLGKALKGDWGGLILSGVWVSHTAGKVGHLPIDDIHASGNSRLIPGLDEEAVCV
jgi:hypothetical protein